MRGRGREPGGRKVIDGNESCALPDQRQSEWLHVTDSAYCRNQAKRCRRLANSLPPHEAKLLTDLADEFEARARCLDEGPP